jgi:hypothetical protein
MFLTRRGLLKFPRTAGGASLTVSPPGIADSFALDWPRKSRERDSTQGGRNPANGGECEPRFRALENITREPLTERSVSPGFWPGFQ